MGSVFGQIQVSCLSLFLVHPAKKIQSSSVWKYAFFREYLLKQLLFLRSGTILNLRDNCNERSDLLVERSIVITESPLMGKLIWNLCEFHSRIHFFIKLS